MLLTLSTTHQPASDLGFLLHKHPDRCQSFDMSFRKVRVFYPEVGPERCSACLLLDVDPVGLARGKNANWATLGLGGINADTPDIRAALFARIADEDEITRGEALVGLARRKDQRAIEPLIKELEGDFAAEHGSYSVEAAEEFAHARLLPVLMRLKESADTDDTRLDEAIRRCS